MFSVPTPILMHCYYSLNLLVEYRIIVNMSIDVRARDLILVKGTLFWIVHYLLVAFSILNVNPMLHLF